MTTDKKVYVLLKVIGLLSTALLTVFIIFPGLIFWIALFVSLIVFGIACVGAAQHPKL
jgi:hypothetical protein